METTCRFSTAARVALLLTVLSAGCAIAREEAPVQRPARFLYVWGGTSHDSTPGLSMITVIDVDSASNRYGTVISSLTVDSSGRMPHHTEFSLPTGRSLFVNDFGGDKSFLIDFSEPSAPKVSGRVASVPRARAMHSFARLTNGNVVATMQFGDSSEAGDPGGLAEFDPSGAIVRSGSSRDSAFPGARIRTYALAAVERVDRVVTTSTPMGNEETAHVVQVWRLSDLTLLKTLRVPEVQGDSLHKYPFEVRELADGSVMLNSYYCGFFRIADLGGTPSITRVLTLSQPRDIGCAVPVIVDKFMIMPIAYAHRFATIDISDPARPREVASLPTESTFFPHWAASDPGSDRLVFTDQGDGVPMVKLARLDRFTGTLSWEARFRTPDAAQPGLSYARLSLPNGFTGMMMTHGALFVP